jgi:DNA polymerase-1
MCWPTTASPSPASRHDTLLQSYVLESGKDGVRGHDLGQLATRHLGLATIPYEALCGKGANQIGFEQVAIGQAAEYAAEDADLCQRLHARALTADRRRRRSGARLRGDRNPGARHPLSGWSVTGVLIDSAISSTRQSHEIGKRLLDLEAAAHTPPPGSRSTSTRRSSSPKSSSTSSACR